MKLSRHYCTSPSVWNGTSDDTHLTGLLQQDAIPLDHDVDPFSLPLPDQLRGWAHTPDTKQHIRHRVKYFSLSTCLIH